MRTRFGARRASSVERELAVAVDDALLATAQRGGDGPIGGRDDVGVDARVVEPEPLPVLGAERPGVAGVGVLVGAPERDVGVAEARRPRSRRRASGP